MTIREITRLSMTRKRPLKLFFCRPGRGASQKRSGEEDVQAVVRHSRLVPRRARTARPSTGTLRRHRRLDRPAGAGLRRRLAKSGLTLREKNAIFSKKKSSKRVPKPGPLGITPFTVKSTFFRDFQGFLKIQVEKSRGKVAEAGA